MAYTKKTLLDCLQSLADRLTNGVVPTDSATLTLWTRLLNRGVNFCADRLRIDDTATITTVGGIGNLPDNFLVMNTVFAGTVEQGKVKEQEIDKHTLAGTYFISGNQTSGFTLNVPSDATFTIEYSMRYPEMVLNSDVCIIPDIEAPVAYAYSLKRKSSADPFGDADAAMAECVSRLDEIQDANQLNSGFQGFEIFE